MFCGGERHQRDRSVDLLGVIDAKTNERNECNVKGLVDGMKRCFSLSKILHSGSCFSC